MRPGVCKCLNFSWPLTWQWSRKNACVNVYAAFQRAEHDKLSRAANGSAGMYRSGSRGQRAKTLLQNLLGLSVQWRGKEPSQILRLISSHANKLYWRSLKWIKYIALVYTLFSSRRHSFKALKGTILCEIHNSQVCDNKISVRAGSERSVFVWGCEQRAQYKGVFFFG